MSATNAKCPWSTLEPRTQSNAVSANLNCIWYSLINQPINQPISQSFTIHRSYSLPLQTQNYTFPQILSTTHPSRPLDCIHGFRTAQQFSFSFSIIFIFRYVCKSYSLLAGFWTTNTLTKKTPWLVDWLIDWLIDWSIQSVCQSVSQSVNQPISMSDKSQQEGWLSPTERESAG